MFSYTDTNFYTKPTYDQSYPNESYKNKYHKQRRHIEQNFDNLFDSNFGKVCQSLESEQNSGSLLKNSPKSYDDIEISSLLEDSTDQDRFKNNINVILKEIESAEDENALKNLCEIEKDIYNNEAYLIDNLVELLEYFKKINGYYNEKVSLLMKQIRNLNNNNDSKVNQSINEQSKINFYLKNIDKLNDEIDKKNVENQQLNKKVMEFKGTNEDISETLINLTQENTLLKYNETKLEKEISEIKTDYEQNHINNLSYFQILKEEKITNYIECSNFEVNHLINLENLFLNGLQTVMKAKNNKISDLKETIGERLECQICREKRSTILLKPCNHQCVCDLCARNLSHCPFDRTKIESFEKVYIP